MALHGRPTRVGFRQAMVVLAVVAGTAVVVWTQAWRRWGDAIGAIPTANLWLLAAALILQGVSMEAFVHLQQVSLQAAGTTVASGPLRRLALRSNAISVTLPIGGSAAATDNTVRTLTRHGVATEAAVTASVLSGVFASAALVAVLVPFLAWSSGGAGRITALVGAAVGFGIPLGLVLLAKWPSFRRSVTRLLRRDPERPGGWRGKLDDSIGQLARTPMTRRLASAGTGYALANRLADAASCVLAVAAFSGSMPRPGWLLGYVVGLGATSLSLTPGGIGTVEVALANALAAGGVATSAAWSGAIAYRLIAVGVVAGAGWLLLALDRSPGVVRSKVSGRVGRRVGPGRPAAFLGVMRSSCCA